MGLSNYQLVLLDNLIYLNSVAWDDAKTVKERVNRLLYENGNSANAAGTGQIKIDYLNYNTENNQCSMDLEEWIQVLKAIEADSTLCNLEIHDVTDDEETGFRAATFISDSENIIIFRGTSSATEWIDNGQGGYSVQTRNQYEALEYVNNLDIVNNNSFVVSGHSKGGNLAQYVALFSTDTLIDKCLAFDGQGFSQELCETEEYQAALERNQANLYMVSSGCDFVNILFNSAVADENRMYIKANFEINPTYYHKPNNIFKIDEEGNIVGLNSADKINTISYFLKDFIDYITVSEPDASKKQIVYDSLMGMMAATADKHDDIDVVTGNLLVEIMIDLGTKAAVELFLTKFGIPQYVTDGVIKVAGKAFQMDSLGEILTADTYKGEAAEFVESGAVDLLADYLKGYVNEKTHNLFTLLCAITDQLSGDLMGAQNTFFEMLENNTWNDIVKVFESESDFGVQKIRDEINSSNVGSSTLGEGTWGHIYSYTQEDGGLVYKGTGGIDSIAGTSGDDYLHGGNGIDVIMGGAGDDVIFGGRGDDVLYSGSGSDIFAVNRYDGNDTIYNQSSDSELNFIFFGEGITHSNANYVKDGNDLYIQYNADYPEECQVKVVNFFLSDGAGNFPNAIDGVMYEDGRIVTIQQILSIVGYDGEKPKSLMEKVKAMTQEERDKILEKYDFLKTEYNLLYGNKSGGQAQEDDRTAGGADVSVNGSGDTGATTGGNSNTDNNDTKDGRSHIGKC